MFNTLRKLTPDRRIFRILACRELGECQMLTHQQRRLGDYRLVKTHAPQNDRHVPRTLGRMVAHARTFADIVQQAGQQQCRVLRVVVPHAARRLASKP